MSDERGEKPVEHTPLPWAATKIAGGRGWEIVAESRDTVVARIEPWSDVADEADVISFRPASPDADPSPSQEGGAR